MKKKTDPEMENNLQEENVEAGVDTETTYEQEMEQQDESSAEMEFIKAELAELKDKYIRQASDFENFRRRKAKEQIDLIATAGEEMIKAVLPVVDDFERARKNAMAENSTENWSEGIELVYNKLANTLKNKGLEPMNSEQGVLFDSNYHEALTQIPAPSDALKGTIIDTVEKGYILNGKIIRHAKVVVGQ